MSLTVVYGQRRFKVPVTPGTLLSQVRDEVCSAERGLNLRSSDYGLAHQGRPIDLTLPFRLSNLVNNAQLTLVHAKKVDDVRVKVRIPKSPDFIAKFPQKTTISEVISAANLQGHLLLNNVRVNPETELGSLGGAGGVLFVFVPSGNSPSRPANVPNSATKPTTSTQTMNATSSNASSSSTNDPSSSNSPIKSHLHSSSSTAAQERQAAVLAATRSEVVDDDPPDMDTKQFATYYQHIKQQAEPPMVSKSTQDSLKAKKPAVESTTVRIRLPEQNMLEGKFVNGEHGVDVYNFVKMYLRDPGMQFELVSMKPYFVLQPSAHLINDCNFTSRVLLAFRTHTPTKGPILNDKALAMARPPAGSGQTDVPSSKESSTGASSKLNDKLKKNSKEESKEDSKGDSKDTKSKFKIKPKWLKLHK